MHCRAVGSRSPPATLHPKYLAEKILTTRSALEGERKQVTVLFADVKGSASGMTCVKNLPHRPEKAQRFLDPPDVA